MSGPENEKTLAILKRELLRKLKIKRIASVTEDFDCAVPQQWKYGIAYITHGDGEIFAETQETKHFPNCLFAPNASFEEEISVYFFQLYFSMTQSAREILNTL